MSAAINQVFRPNGGDLTRDLPGFLGPENLANLHVVVGARGEILAHAGFLPRDAVVRGRPRRVACVGAVFVDPACRGQGLATHTLAAVLEAARPASDLLLVSGAGGLYRRAGLQPIPPPWQFRVPAAAPAAARIRIREVVPDNPDDIDVLEDMYNGLDVHFVRSGVDWRRLLAAGVLMDSPGRLSLIERSGVPVAYAAVQGAREPATASARAGGEPRRGPRILEFAGDVEAIADAAAELAETWVAPAHDATTRALLERRGWSGAPRSFPISARHLAAGDDGAPIPWYGLDYL